MKLFIVRHIFDKRVIGLFWCKNVSQLVWLVDEGADPLTAEYAVVEKSAVIRWGRRGPTVGGQHRMHGRLFLLLKTIRQAYLDSPIQRVAALATDAATDC